MAVQGRGLGLEQARDKASHYHRARCLVAGELCGTRVKTRV